MITTTLLVLAALAMLAGNALFVGAEFGLISARRSTIELEALKGSIAARVTLKAMENVSLMLAGAQLGVTVCSLIFGAVGEPLISHLLEQPFGALGIPELWLHPFSILIALIIMVYMHVVIGEVVPKNLALASPAKVALRLIPPLVVFVKIFKPLIIVFNAIANGTLRLFGLRPKQELTNSFNRDEVAGFVKESLREGLLSSSEEQLLSGSLHFDDAAISSVLIPIKKVVAAPNQPTPADVEKLAAQTGFSRFPVTGKKSLFKGYVHLKDVLRIPDDEYDDPLPSHMIRPLASIKFDSTLRQALAIMQQSNEHLAKVIDDNENIVGMIALEDVIEELVGEIRDETRK